MNPTTLNLGKNVRFAIAEFVIAPMLVVFSYGFVLRQGGVATVGLWSTLFAWMSLVRLGDPGMANATMRFVALRSGDGRSANAGDYIETGILANALALAVLTSGCYGLVAAFIGQIVPPDAVDGARGVLPAMAVGLFFFSQSNAVLSALQGMHLGFVRSKLAILGGVINLAGVALLVPRLGLVGLAVAQILQYGTMTILGWIAVRRASGIRNWLPWRIRRTVLTEMLGFSVMTQVASVSNGLFEPVSKILVSQAGGLALQGVYELAYKTVWLSRNAIVAGVAATVPAMTTLHQRNQAAVVPIYRQTLRLSFVSVCGIMLLLVLVSPLLSMAWIGVLDWNYTLFVAILAVGALFSAAGAPAYGLALVTGQTRHIVVVNLGVLALLIGAGLAARTLSPHILVATIALAMAIGGLWIKARNERLLAPASGAEPAAP